MMSLTEMEPGGPGGPGGPGMPGVLSYPLTGPECVNVIRELHHCYNGSSV